MKMIFNRVVLLFVLAMTSTGMACAEQPLTEQGLKPNILWIVVEDASCHISCYGETAIQTPEIDKLAANGIRFDNAFVTCPVCSPSRSAMVTGMYQTTIGAHNHRSQRASGKGATNKEYHSSFVLPNEVPFAGELFEKAGYYTSNQSMKGRLGKEDYNFVRNKTYQGHSWENCPDDKPFFAQIQLSGGKNRNRLAETNDFDLPPYYFDDSVLRQDWQRYLGSWLDVDDELKQIVADLKRAGRYDNTLIAFFTDHGISHLRGKQFLYDEGIKIPLIIKMPDNAITGEVRNDQVQQIDLLATSLGVAGIPIPEQLQGVNILAKDYQPQTHIYSARDRCDETTEIVRCVRTPRFKYIRNFLSYRPHAQRNQYKDGKEISTHTRELFEAGKLNELQSRFYNPTRPPEELYDLVNDPMELNNLAAHPSYQNKLNELRASLFHWMKESRDQGLIPEPILEEWGKEYGNKYLAMKDKGTPELYDRIIQIITAGENDITSLLVEASQAPNPVERYWACTWLGNSSASIAPKAIRPLLDDVDPTVRIAANLAMHKVSKDFDPIPGLGKEIENTNQIVGMYAFWAMEQTGIRNRQVWEIAKDNLDNGYEFTMRYARYLESVTK